MSIKIDWTGIHFKVIFNMIWVHGNSIIRDWNWVTYLAIIHTPSLSWSNCRELTNIRVHLIVSFIFIHANKLLLDLAVHALRLREPMLFFSLVLILIEKVDLVKDVSQKIGSQRLREHLIHARVNGCFDVFILDMASQSYN